MFTHLLSVTSVPFKGQDGLGPILESLGMKQEYTLDGTMGHQYRPTCFCKMEGNTHGHARKHFTDINLSSRLNQTSWCCEASTLHITCHARPLQGFQNFFQNFPQVKMLFKMNPLQTAMINHQDSRPETGVYLRCQLSIDML